MQIHTIQSGKDPASLITISASVYFLTFWKTRNMKLNTYRDSCEVFGTARSHYIVNIVDSIANCQCGFNNIYIVQVAVVNCHRSKVIDTDGWHHLQVNCLPLMGAVHLTDAADAGTDAKTSSEPPGM